MRRRLWPTTRPAKALTKHIYMTKSSEWKGIITGLRIDPAINCSIGNDPTYYGEITIER